MQPNLDIVSGDVDIDAENGYRTLSMHLCYVTIITARKRNFGKVMFLHLSVILFTRRSAFPQCHGASIGRSPCRLSPSFRRQTPPPDTVNQQAVCITLECILVCIIFVNAKHGKCEWTFKLMVSVEFKLYVCLFLNKIYLGYPKVIPEKNILKFVANF